MAARALDLGLGGLGPIQLSSQPFTVVALVEHSPRTQALLVRKDSGIKSVADLKGRKLGSYGTTINANLFVLRAAEKAGTDAGGIRFVPLTTDQITAALLSGSVDAVQTWDSFAAQLEASKRTRTLLTGQGLVENHVVIYGHRLCDIRCSDQERRLGRGRRPQDRREGPGRGWIWLKSVVNSCGSGGRRKVTSA